MRRICNQQYPALSKARGASLLQLVWTHAEELVVTWFGVPGKNLLVSHWLAAHNFGTVKVCVVAICYTPKTICCDPSRHVPIFGMTNKVGIPEIESLVKWEVYLGSLASYTCKTTESSNSNTHSSLQFVVLTFPLDTPFRKVRFVHRLRHHLRRQDNSR
jgi:hypothetical protein